MLKVFDLFSFIRAQKQANIGIWNSLSSIVSQMIVDLDIKEITTESLCISFTEYYRYRIPMHPMKELIGKMINANYITRDDTILRVNFKKIKEETPAIKETIGYFDGLIYRIIRYIFEKFQYSATEIQVQEALIRYLDEYHTDIIKGIHSEHVFVVKDCDSDLTYMLNRFVTEELTTIEDRNNLIDLLIANINLSAIFFSTKNKIRNRSKCTVYIDTRLLLRLIGLEGDFRKKEYEQLFDIFTKNDYVLKIFQIHYEELLGIMDDCIYWLDHKEKYNSRFASPALRHFVENNYDSSQVIVFKKKIEKIFEKYKIKVDEYSYDNIEELTYTIDENKLYEIIVEEYEIEKESFEEYSKSKIIWNDVKAISYIYRRRRGVRPHSLSTVNYVFLTINASLARATRRLSSSDNGVFYEFHECMTDSFFGTYLWLNSTAENVGILRSRLLASSQNYIKCNNRLKSSYLALVYAKKETDEIDEDEFQFLKESEIALEIATDKTLNNYSNISDKLPEEIIATYKERLKNEVRSEYEKRENNLIESARKAEYLKEETMKKIFDRDDKINNILNRIERKSKRDAKIFCFFIGALCFSPPIVLIFADLITNTSLKFVISFISVIIGCIFTYYGFSIKGLADIIFQKLNNNRKKGLGLLN